MMMSACLALTPVGLKVDPSACGWGWLVVLAMVELCHQDHKSIVEDLVFIVQALAMVILCKSKKYHHFMLILQRKLVPSIIFTQFFCEDSTIVSNIWQYFLNYFRYWVTLPSDYFGIIMEHPSNNEWIYVVMNYIGPNDGQGLRIYHNSILVANDTTLTSRQWYPGNRKIVVGRHYNGADHWYSSVQVDELYFFNRFLTEAEIRMLSGNTVWARPVPQKARTLQCLNVISLWYVTT